MKVTKKILAALLACIMLFCVIPTSIFAEDSILAGAPNGIWVAGKEIDSTKESYWLNDNQGGITQTGASESKYNVKYTPATEESKATLTLNNANLSQDIKWDAEFYGAASSNSTLNSAVIYAPKNVALVINLEGENTVKSEAKLKYNENYRMRYYTYGITKISGITGNGSLEVDVAANKISELAERAGYEDTAVGIYGSNLSINDKANVKSTVKMNSDCEGMRAVMAYAIQSETLMSIWENAVVVANASRTNAANTRDYVLGIGATLTVSDKATVVADAERAVTNITVSGGTIELINRGSTIANAINLNGDAKSVKVNTQPTAEGAVEWDKETNIRTYKYVKIEHYGKFMATIRSIGRKIADIIKTIKEILAFLKK